MIADDSWRDAAACKGLDTNLFFAERGETVSDAIAVCDTCSVQLECLTFALDHAIREGVWGGRSENQRKRIRKGRPRRIECAHCHRTFVHVPNGVGARSATCSLECREARRREQQRTTNRLREQDRRAHARRERSRARGDVGLDSLEDGAA